MVFYYCAEVDNRAMLVFIFFSDIDASRCHMEAALFRLRAVSRDSIIWHGS